MTKRTSGKQPAKRSAEPAGDVESVTTVVGGQPPRHVRAKNRVPIGVEKVLYLAATDAGFRRALLEEREATLARSGVRLTNVERTTLLGVPRAALETMISRISPQRHGKRSFMKTVAAATVSLAAGVAAAGCNEDEGDRLPDTGDVVETGGDTADVEDIDPTRGATADVPDTADVDATPEYAPGGVMPDADYDAGFEPDAGE
jgi:hypothetical protein